ncbi:MAG: PDDEXK nuclease domain-containing protein [Prevotella sp.]|nr:PDDEXK nuclease domain-containing protein [Prevotella sp.]
MKSISILDSEYKQWIKELSTRYRQSQIKAAVKVNEEMLRFYWRLGQDIVSMKADIRWGNNFFGNLSKDLKEFIPDATCFSRTNLVYMKNFYLLYKPFIEITQQPAEQNENSVIVQQVVEQIKNAENTQQLAKKNEDSLIVQQVVEQIKNDENTQQVAKKNESPVITQQVVEQIKNDENTQQVIEQNENSEFVQQVAEQIKKDIFSIPWGHHVLLIDKFLHDSPEKALFYVRETINNGWSRSVLLNSIKTKLDERKAKALNNFVNTLPDVTSDLAKEITKDPYNFAFTGVTGRYNERILKDALLANITDFLIELGTGFAYIGKEYRLQIGETENFIDLLFYNLKLSCYVVIEVKIGKFEFGDAGQLGGYVVACNHILRKAGRDNPTIGLLICKEKDRIQAQYALEASTQPIAISEYELEKFYPEKIEGTIPTIKEIETKLNELKDDK